MSSVRLRIRCSDGELTVKAYFWFLRFTVIPQKEKPKKQHTDNQKDRQGEKKSSKKSKPAKEKSNFIKEKIEQDGIADTVGYLIDTAKYFLHKLGDMLSHLHITRLRLRLGVDGEDAADAAVKCGAINAVVFTFLGWVACVTKFPHHDVDIFPVYDGDGSIELDCKLRLRVIHAVKALFSAAFKIIQMKETKTKVNTNTNKDGALK